MVIELMHFIFFIVDDFHFLNIDLYLPIIVLKLSEHSKTFSDFYVSVCQKLLKLRINLSVLLRPHNAVDDFSAIVKSKDNSVFLFNEEDADASNLRFCDEVPVSVDEDVPEFGQVVFVHVHVEVFFIFIHCELNIPLSNAEIRNRSDILFKLHVQSFEVDVAEAVVQLTDHCVSENFHFAGTILIQ